MLLHGAHGRKMAACADSYLDIQQELRFRRRDRKRRLLHVPGQRRNFVGRHVRHDLQACLRIARQRADGRRRFDAAQSAGVRHNDTLDILDDIAACSNVDLGWQHPQSFSCHCRAVCNRNRLRAPHRTHKLAF